MSKDDHTPRVDVPAEQPAAPEDSADEIQAENEAVKEGSLKGSRRNTFGYAEADRKAAVGNPDYKPRF